MQSAFHLIVNFKISKQKVFTPIWKSWSFTTLNEIIYKMFTNKSIYKAFITILYLSEQWHEYFNISHVGDMHGLIT